MFNGDTSEYYGGTYPSPPEDYDEDKQEVDYDDYLDYLSDYYTEEYLLNRMEDDE